MRSLFFSLTLMLGVNVSASLVQPESIKEMAQSSSLIFEGEVSAVASKYSGSDIVSYVTYNFHDVIKGDEAKRKVTLLYRGGILNGRVEFTSGVDIPSVGERGIYFVRNPAVKYMHPLTGWEQGRYPIELVNGVLSVRYKSNDSSEHELLHHDTAHTEHIKLLAVEEFKEAIRKVLR